MNDLYLMTFHIGPVQEFIAAARRSRDLWFGSWLLSELPKAAALELVNLNDGNVNCLVFPAPQNIDELKNDDFCCPNKIVALTGQKPAELGKKVHDALKNRLSEICDDTFNRIKGDFIRETAEQQVNDLLEYYWTAYPVHESYSKARTYAESIMAARKTMRDFQPVKWGGPVFKSSLDGKRESVIPKKVYDTYNEEQLRQKLGVRKGEFLCGIGLLKRNGVRGKGKGSSRFPSTSHFAALPFLESLKDRQAAEGYINKLRFLGIPNDVLGTVLVRHAAFDYNDGHLLYEERLKEYFEDTKKLKQATMALRNFLEKAFKGQKPLPYYAILLADGDNMGRVINELDQAEKHRKLSQILSRFAVWAKDIVEEFKGSLIYSGGDDVLAFVPLHTVLRCARELADNFFHELRHFQVTENGKGFSPTLSVGIAVVHHLEPLSEALTLTRNAEKMAKTLDGKNALAVTVSKRSGADCSVVGRWGAIDRRLDSFINLHREDLIPDRAAFELRDLALRLQLDENIDRSAEDNKIIDNIIQIEAIRILQRKETDRGKKPIRKDVLQELEKYIKQDKIPVKKLAEELIVARLFAESIEQSEVGLGIPVNKFQEVEE